MANILIVDDDEMQRLLLQTILDAEGHELFYAPSGRVAKEIILRRAIDLVVTDLVMPEVNGLRLIKELREDGETMPIIAISGIVPEQLDLALDYGATIALYKPIKREKLLGAVRSCLGH